MPKGIYDKTKSKPIIKKGVYIRCKFCGKEFYIRRCLIKIRKYCSIYCSDKGKKGWHHSKEAKEKVSFANKGKKHGQWNGGITFSRGYKMILNPIHPACNFYGYVREHRIIVEKQLGRYLKPKEKVHHLNKIKTDNRPENLMAFKNHSIHLKFHKDPNKVKPFEIIFDGRKLNLCLE